MSTSRPPIRFFLDHATLLPGPARHHARRARRGGVRAFLGAFRHAVAGPAAGMGDVGAHRRVATNVGHGRMGAAHARAVARGAGRCGCHAGHRRRRGPGAGQRARGGHVRQPARRGPGVCGHRRLHRAAAGAGPPAQGSAPRHRGHIGPCSAPGRSPSALASARLGPPCGAGASALLAERPAGCGVFPPGPHRGHRTRALVRHAGPAARLLHRPARRHAAPLGAAHHRAAVGGGRAGLWRPGGQGRAGAMGGGVCTVRSGSRGPTAAARAAGTALAADGQ